MEEFRSNLLLLLHNRYPQGMMVNKLGEEYEKYYLKHVEPYMFYAESPSWRNVFEKTYLNKDLQTFEINNCIYVKPTGIRSEGEMALIAKLAKYSHFHYAQESFFQIRDCTCCQVYTSFPMNHYPSSTISSSQYTTNTSIQNPPSEYRTVQYVQAPTAGLQGAAVVAASPGLQATNLSMNGAIKYDGTRYDDIRSSRDYYIMLQTNQNTRYDQLGNVISSSLEHRSPEPPAIAATTSRVAYANAHPVAPAAVPNTQQQWSGRPSEPPPPPTPPTTTVSPPKTKGKGKGRTPKAAAETPKGKGKGGDKELHHCRWEGCKKSFRRFKLLENHERLAHHKEGDDSLSCSTVGCKMKFEDKKILQHHESRCILKPHRCSWQGCDKTFRTSKLLHGHISAVHRKVGRNTFKCTIPGCAQAYPDSTKLKTHEIRCRFRYETLIEMESESVNNASSSTSDDQNKSTVNLYMVKNEGGDPCFVQTHI